MRASEGHNRTMIKTMKRIGAVAVAVAVTAVAVVGGAPALVGGAEATATGTTYASITELSGESYNGQVDGVTLATTGVVNWSNMPDDAETVHVELEAKHDGEYQTVATEEYDVDAGSTGEYSYDPVSGELLDSTDFESADFSADEDGERRSEYITVRVTVTVTDASGETCVLTETHKVVTEVKNLADPTVGGDTGVDGEIDMDDSECVECHVGTVNDEYTTETDTETDHDESDHDHSGHEDHDHSYSDRDEPADQSNNNGEVEHGENV
jgi:hypothetical protein